MSLCSREKNLILASLRKDLVDYEFSISEKYGAPYLLGKIEERLLVISNLTKPIDSPLCIADKINSSVKRCFEEIVQYCIAGIHLTIKDNNNAKRVSKDCAPLQNIS